MHTRTMLGGRLLSAIEEWTEHTCYRLAMARSSAVLSEITKRFRKHQAVCHR